MEKDVSDEQISFLFLKNDVWSTLLIMEYHKDGEEFSSLDYPSTSDVHKRINGQKNPIEWVNHEQGIITRKIIKE